MKANTAELYIEKLINENTELKTEADRWRDNFKQMAFNYRQKCRDIAELEVEIGKLQRGENS